MAYKMKCNAQPGKLFVGGLSFETTEEKLFHYFSRFGQVSETIVMVDPSTRRSRGFGFVTFVDVAASEAVMARKDHHIDFRRVECKWAVPREAVGAAPVSSRPPSMNRKSDHSRPKAVSLTPDSLWASSHEPLRKLFVGGLHYETNDESLRSYFEQFGAVEVAQVLFNRDTNKSRGFGFVTFVDPESAHLALGYRIHNVDGKDVEIKMAVPKVEGGLPNGVVSEGGYRMRSATGNLSSSFPRSHSNNIYDAMEGNASSAGSTPSKWRDATFYRTRAQTTNLVFGVPESEDAADMISLSNDIEFLVNSSASDFVDSRAGSGLFRGSFDLTGSDSVLRNTSISSEVTSIFNQTPVTPSLVPDRSSFNSISPSESFLESRLSKSGTHSPFSSTSPIGGPVFPTDHASPGFLTKPTLLDTPRKLSAGASPFSSFNGYNTSSPFNGPAESSFNNFRLDNNLYSSFEGLGLSEKKSKGGDIWSMLESPATGQTVPTSLW